VLTARIVLDNPQSGKQEAPGDDLGAFAFLELMTGQKEGRPGIRYYGGLVRTGRFW
jgi:hypothetical protein